MASTAGPWPTGVCMGKARPTPRLEDSSGMTSRRLKPFFRITLSGLRTSQKSRLKALHGFLLNIRDKVAVPFCHGKGLMPHELFDGQDVGSVDGQPGSKGMAQGVEGHLLAGIGDSLVPAKFFQDSDKGIGHPLDRLPVPVDEDKLFRIPASVLKNLPEAVRQEGFSLSLIHI